MIVDRRTTLAGLLGSAALGATPARPAIGSPATVAIADSRLPAGRAFLAREAARTIDIAAAHDDLWRELRTFTRDGSRVAGLTRWSDWIGVRGLLLEKGLRVRSETAVPHATPRGGTLIAWEMA